jgi:predicted nucleic acid-binding protein
MYCDTSALLKLYVSEPGSGDFNRLVEGRDDLLVSDLTVTEVISALGRRLRDGVGTLETAHRVQRAIVGRLDDGTYRRVELTREVHRRAEHFLLSLTESRLRAADALHLALAGSAHAASIASFDSRLAAAARAIGLATYPSA